MRNPPLMDWGNAIVKSRTDVGEVVTRMELTLDLDGDFKTTKNKISWVSKRGEVIVELIEYGNLMNNEESEDLALSFNNDSMEKEYWYAEHAVAVIKKEDVVQFERIRFYYDGLIFNLLPFTKQKRPMH